MNGDTRRNERAATRLERQWRLDNRAEIHAGRSQRRRRGHGKFGADAGVQHFHFDIDHDLERPLGDLLFLDARNASTRLSNARAKSSLSLRGSFSSPSAQNNVSSFSAASKPFPRPT